MPGYCVILLFISKEILAGKANLNVITPFKLIFEGLIPYGLLSNGMHLANPPGLIVASTSA